MLSRLQYSLSARLLILFLCAGAIILLLVGSLLGKGFSRHVRSGVEPFMAHYVELMQRDLGSPPLLENATRMTADAPVDIHVFGPGEPWTTAPIQLDRSLLPAESSQPGPGGYRIWRIDERLYLHLRDGRHDIYFEVHDPGIDAPVSDFALFILAAILAVLVLIYITTRLLFAPIDDIEEGVRRIATGDLAHRISKRRNDQLGALTDSINDMAYRISNMLEAKRQFLLGVSHELRSPLTRIRVNLALLERSRTRRAIDADIGAMDALIGELLESERLNSPHRVIQPKLTAVSELVEELLADEFPDQPVSQSLDEFNAEVDQARFRLLLRNLVQNALKYNRRGTPVEVSLAMRSPGFELRVRDHGQGIAREHIPLLTEPFYRVDPSRRRLTGGYGLGLYLCNMIVRAHLGQMRIDSEPGVGTTIICSLPLAQPSAPAAPAEPQPRSTSIS